MKRQVSILGEFRITVDTCVRFTIGFEWSEVRETDQGLVTVQTCKSKNLADP